MPEICKKMPEICKKIPETVKIDPKAAETRPRQRKMEKSLLGRILPKLPNEILAGKQPK